MVEDLQEKYARHKKQLLGIISGLEDTIPDKRLTEKLPGISRDLEEEKFRLVVLGQFKRGKSTFINALLGQNVLPADVIPVTAVITEIQYGKSPSAQIIFHEGASETVEIEQINSFASESENPKNKKHVDKIKVFYPAGILQKGLILVDTPGIGSIHEHNTRLTREYIPQVDAAIFIFSSEPPLTELELEFLRTILPIVPHIEFVLNKKDYISEKDLDRVIMFNRDVLCTLSDEQFSITPVSALFGLKQKINPKEKPSIDSGMIQLEKKLNDFLINNKGKYIIVSNTQRIVRICQEWKNLAELDQKAKSLSVDQLNSNLEKFQSYMDKIRRDSERLKFLLEGLKTRLLESFDKESKQFVTDTSRRIKQDVYNFLRESRGKGQRWVMQEAEVKTNNLIVDRFEPFRLVVELKIKDKYAEEIAVINEDVNRIISDIYKFSARLFDIEEMAQVGNDAWRYKSRFFYKTWEVTTSLDLIENVFITLLPGFLFYSLEKKRVRKLIPQKLKRQYGRLRADLLYGLDDNNLSFIFEFSQLLKRIEVEISELIQKHLSLKEKGEEELSESILKHKNIVAEVENILDRAGEIEKEWQ